MDNYPNDQGVRLNFKISTVRLFVKAVKRYKELLDEHNTPGNDQIKKEVSDMANFLSYFNELIASKAGSAWHDVDVEFMGKNYGKILDILWKYQSYKRQLFEENPKRITVPAALEGDDKELQELAAVLALPCWEKFTRHSTLIDSFYGTSGVKAEPSIPQMQINIQQLNGMFAGVNSGSMVQNQNKEVLDALIGLAEVLKLNPVTDQTASEALENIQSFQAEMLKPHPDKTILEKLDAGLQTLANFVQIPTFVIAVAPHLHTIHSFVTSLFH